jgi:hypothetical protein
MLGVFFVQTMLGVFTCTTKYIYIIIIEFFIRFDL